MKLTIALVAASVVLRFQTPAPGSYYVWTRQTPQLARIVASGHEYAPAHVSVTLPAGQSVELFNVLFVPDAEPKVP